MGAIGERDLVDVFVASCEVLLVAYRPQQFIKAEAILWRGLARRKHFVEQEEGLPISALRLARQFLA